MVKNNIKQCSGLFLLLSFGESLAIKFMLLNIESCKARPFLIDLNPVDLKYYPLMISLDK